MNRFLYILVLFEFSAVYLFSQGEGSETVRGDTILLNSTYYTSQADSVGVMGEKLGIILLETGIADFRMNLRSWSSLTVKAALADRFHFIAKYSTAAKKNLTPFHFLALMGGYNLAFDRQNKFTGEISTGFSYVLGEMSWFSIPMNLNISYRFSKHALVSLSADSYSAEIGLFAVSIGMGFVY